MISMQKTPKFINTVELVEVVAFFKEIITGE